MTNAGGRDSSACLADHPGTSHRTVQADAGWLDRIPKVELHLHLEGAIPPDTLWALIEKYGADARAPTRAALDEVFRYRDFPEFIEIWLWKHGFIREPADFEQIAAGFAAGLARQRIVYAEVFFSPSDVRPTGMSTGSVAESIRHGLDAVPDVEVALIADLVRDQGPVGSARTLEEVAELRDLGVIGVGIGGSEQTFPPERYAPVFRRARELGLRTTAHAGEAAGPESVWGALRTLEVERIGHGTRAAEDDELVDYLAARRIPVECCPGSNVRTGVVRSLEEHPIRRFVDRGVLVSVNTDDPAMFGNSLAGEYRALQERLGFSEGEIGRLMLDAVESTWLGPEAKSAIRARIVGDPAWPGM